MLGITCSGAVVAFVAPARYRRSILREGAMAPGAMTADQHQWDIRRDYGYGDFSDRADEPSRESRPERGC